ncbi:helix-turn-helix domain-containing protein [Acutalibacter muris]|uniref:helix-turn-helix domain-containing protein n=1 Tax=Acutalibacter muris TaxID=1796620 RepID=UPI001C3ED1E6|nr:helix-turn-helix transcriptional regulator [Acutalibacter muris]
MYDDFFSVRLARLRTQKGVSAREMSLSLGQADNYINSIENKKNFPSMQNFFYICEYLNITPQQFFDTDVKHPAKVDELIEAVKGLSGEQLDNLIAIAKGLRR